MTATLVTCVHEQTLWNFDLIVRVCTINVFDDKHKSYGCQHYQTLVRSTYTVNLLPAENHLD